MEYYTVKKRNEFLLHVRIMDKAHGYSTDEPISGAGVEMQMQRTDMWPQGWEGAGGELGG